MLTKAAFIRANSKNNNIEEYYYNKKKNFCI